MFVAYSKVLHRDVNVNEMFDLNEIFCCSNRNCSARLVIRGSTGKRAKHFLTLSSAAHIEGCEYENLDGRYQRPELQKRSSIEDIFNDLRDPSRQPGTPKKKATSSGGSGILRINSPRKLRDFCRYNTLETEYMSGITVNDIILDERNVIRDRNYEGISGLRMLVGETYKFDDKGIYLVTKAPSQDGKVKYLNTIVMMDRGLLQDVKKYILDTQNNKFKGYRLSVFGYWRKDKMYWSSCEVTNQEHVILKW